MYITFCKYNVTMTTYSSWRSQAMDGRDDGEIPKRKNSNSFKIKDGKILIIIQMRFFSSMLLCIWVCWSLALSSRRNFELRVEGRKIILQCYRFVWVREMRRGIVHQTFSSRTIFWIEIKWKCFFTINKFSLWQNFLRYFLSTTPLKSIRERFFQDLFSWYLSLRIALGNFHSALCRMSETTNMCTRTYDAVKKAGKSFHNTCPLQSGGFV